MNLNNVSDFALEIMTLDEQMIRFLSYCLLSMGVISGIALQFVNGPYGRYSQNGWGFAIDVNMAWFLQELPAFVIPLFIFLFTQSPRLEDWRNCLIMCLYCIHYTQRTFIYPFLIKSGTPLPCTIFLVALSVCTLNGYIQGAYLLHHTNIGTDTVSVLTFYMGLISFLVGMFINVHSDYILRNLRKPGETGYKIPKGGMFEFVSGANFLGECVEWFGFAMACQTMPATVFAIFSLLNLGPRACQHHKYYLEKFEDYPKKRKAFIPFLL